MGHDRQQDKVDSRSDQSNSKETCNGARMKPDTLTDLGAAMAAGLRLG
jgi:hypothetical protein